MPISPIIDHTTLKKWLTHPEEIMLFDASWYGPGRSHYAKQAFLHRHICGAHFFDLTQFPQNYATLYDLLFHSATQLYTADHTPQCKIIFYDNSPYHSSCRAFWISKILGYPLHQLYVLDRTLDSWEKHQGKIIRSNHPDLPSIKQSYFPVHLQTQYLRTLAQMQANLQDVTEQVVDLRHAIDYVGGCSKAPTARLRLGHIPGSFSCPLTTLFTPDGSWKAIEVIYKQLIGIGIEMMAPIVSLSDTGITAAILNVALDSLQHSQHALYDGSWAEWGAATLYPKELTLQSRPVVTSLESSLNA